MKGWRGKKVITMGLLKLFSSTHLITTGELTHTVVPYAHKVVVSVQKRGGGEPLKNMGPLKWFSSRFLRRIYPHSDSV